MKVSKKYSILHTMKFINNMNLTITEALLVAKTGWKTEEERELSDIAFDVLSQEKRKLVLRYKKEKLEYELWESGQQLDISPSERIPSYKITDEEIRKAAHNWATSKTTRSTDFWNALVDAYISAATFIKDKK